MRRLPLLLAAAVAIAGCTLLSSFDGLSDGENVAPDGGSTATDGGPGGGGDGGATPGPDGGDGKPGGCRGEGFANATFCVDFDEGDPLAPGTWTEVNSDPEGNVFHLATDASVSAPRSAYLFANNPTPDSCSYMTLARRTVGSFNRVRARGAVLALHDGAVASLDLGEVTWVLYFHEHATVDIHATRANGNGTFTRETKSVPLDVPPLGRWVAFDFEIIDEPSKYVVVVDGKTTDLPLTSDLELDDPNLTVGPRCATPPQAAFVDDIALWATSQ